MRWVAAVCLHAGYNNKVFLTTAARRKRPFNVARILRIDIILNYDNELLRG